MTGNERARVLALVCFSCLFVVSFAIAARLYPGGTWFDPAHEGHHLWQTFLCDMIRDPALNGEPNPAVAWATIGLISVVPALALLWSLLNRLLPMPRLVRVARWLGFIGLIGIAAIPLTPSDEYPLAHSFAVVVGGITTLAAIGLSVFGQARSGLRGIAWLGGGTLGVFLVSLGLYVHHGFLGGSLTPALPTSQKIAAGLAFAWLIAIAHRIWRSAPPPG